MTTRERLIKLKECGVSLRRVAEKAECSAQTLTNWINSEKPISSRMERSIKEAIEMIKEEISGI